MHNNSKEDRKTRYKRIIKNVKWLYTFGKKQWLYVLLFTVLGMTGSVVGFIGSFASRDMVDIITGKLVGELLKTFLTVVGVSLLTLLINQTSAYISAYISTKLENRLKADVYDDIMHSKLEALESYNSGYISARWASDTSTLVSGVLDFVPGLINNVFKLVSAFVIMARNDISFVIFALISVPLGYIASKSNIRRSKDVNNESMAQSSKISLFINESFLNTQIIKAFDLVGTYSGKIRKLQDDSFKTRLKSQKVMGFNSAVFTIVGIIVTYSTLGWGVYKVWTGHISYGDMTLLIGMSTMLSSSIQSMITMVNTLGRLTVSAERITELTSLPKEDYSSHDEVMQFFERQNGHGIGIKITDEEFTYANGTRVFEALDFEAAPGETVGLVGPSGEGKTTLLRILLALIYSKKGSARIYSSWDKNDYIDVSASARSLIAYVPQGNTMFAGTIADNLRDFKEDATREEMEEALKLACAWDFVSKLPDGMDSVIKERGGGFSEGQAQRIAIARALLKKAPILLLDEATSALDLSTARKVLENISKCDYVRTCILTTHRPEVVKICDKVYTIASGNISLNDKDYEMK